jgi:hypothetical protein
MFEADLRRLNDAIARTEFRGRYRLLGGLLLGWAREGRVLGHDLRDADFAYDGDDHDLFLAIVPELRAAGFRPMLRYRNNAGQHTEHCFSRRGAKFEFFRLDRVGDKHRYHLYGTDPARPDEQLEIVCELDAQPWEPVDFIGRTWLKPADHEAELELVYGSWRIPDPTWFFLDDGSKVSSRKWEVSDNTWR